MFQTLTSLAGLDNADRNSTALLVDGGKNPGLQSYLDVLKDASDLAEALATRGGVQVTGPVPVLPLNQGALQPSPPAVVVHTPRIDRALDDYRRRAKEPDEWDPDNSQHHARAARSHRILYLHTQREQQTAAPGSTDKQAPPSKQQALSGRNGIPIPVSW